MSDEQVNGSEQHPTARAAKAVGDAIRPLLSTHDPRALVQGLLMSGVTLSQRIISAKRWTHADVAMEFSQALCAALDAEPTKPLIQVADATGQIRQ